MVFHDIGSITDVLTGQRVIIYYIESKLIGIKRNEIKLCTKILETALEMLEKKNDDLLIIKVVHGSEQFHQFAEIYRPEVTGVATLFVINNEGIPLICEQINHADSISNVMESLSVNCQLKQISKIDINKITQSEIESVPILKVENVRKSASLKPTHSATLPKTSISTVEVKDSEVHKPSVNQATETNVLQRNQPSSAELQIRLPDGNKVVQKFNKDAILQNVWDFISNKYHIKDFDLKTYERAFSQAEYGQFLQELGLYPNGVVIVVVKNIIPLNNNRSIGVMIQYGFRLLFISTTSVFRYLQGILFLFWNSLFSTRPSSDSDGNRPGGTGRTQDNSNNPSTSNRGATKSSKTFGNIHTLHRSDDSDDENNRYNGNSTQQK